MTPSPGHIQLVDDSPDVRLHLADLLRKMGYSVEVFAGAEEFLVSEPAPRPSVLLLDMRMPGLTGLELLSRLRAQGRRTPVVFISGQSRTQEIIDAMKQGAIDFLCKPFTREQLVEAVDRGLALDRRFADESLRLERVQQRFSTLSPREREMFFPILRGHTNRAIAALTGLQAATVKKHRAAVLDKMMVATVAELIRACEGLDLDALAVATAPALA